MLTFNSNKFKNDRKMGNTIMDIAKPKIVFLKLKKVKQDGCIA